MSYALFSITEQQSVGPESTERDTRLSVTSLLDHCKRRNTKQTATSRKWKVGGGQKEKGHRPDLLDVECVNLLSSTLSQVIVCVCVCVCVAVVRLEGKKKKREEDFTRRQRPTKKDHQSNRTQFSISPQLRISFLSFFFFFFFCRLSDTLCVWRRRRRRRRLVFSPLSQKY